ncbi:MAG: sulfatase-like hydrolase/transferase, partial [Aeoliella sp.]
MYRSTKRSQWLCLAVALVAVAGSLLLSSPAHAADDRPNILWIFVEDLSPWIGCYGDKINEGKTPTIDALAERGVRFERCYVPAPVCSACRSAIITGAMQTTTGTHHHRSSRTPDSAIHLPDGMKTIPELFREQGYFTFNRGKDDYNFVYDRPRLYSVGSRKKKGSTFYGANGSGDWGDRPEGTPFFGQIQLGGGKTRTNGLKDKVSPSEVEVPPYFPNNELFQSEWAHHYDCARVTDQHVNRILSRLKEDGLLEKTIVFFFTD